MKSFGSEALLLPTYLLMLAICVFLNVYGQAKPDPVNITVNAGMFVIIGITMLWATYGALNPVSRMASSLRYTVQTMEIDFKKTENYLWEDYRNETNLFHNKILNHRFNEYRVERKRLMMLSSRGVKCDIEDYINEYFIDSNIKKGMLAIIPGVMTGLGILGTFIGLSFGLQNFNTGNAQEITNSIAPLMDGIKVAFHTSIYGMVFSLIFNFVYKKTLEDAYHAVDQFLNTYHKYVLPKTENDDLEVLLSFQEKQLQETKKMLSEFSDELAGKLAAAVANPYYYQAQETAVSGETFFTEEPASEKTFYAGKTAASEEPVFTEELFTGNPGTETSAAAKRAAGKMKEEKAVNHAAEKKNIGLDDEEKIQPKDFFIQ